MESASRTQLIVYCATHMKSGNTQEQEINKGANLEIKMSINKEINCAKSY